MLNFLKSLLYYISATQAGLSCHGLLKTRDVGGILYTMETRPPLSPIVYDNFGTCSSTYQEKIKNKTKKIKINKNNHYLTQIEMLK